MIKKDAARRSRPRCSTPPVVIPAIQGGDDVNPSQKEEAAKGDLDELLSKPQIDVDRLATFLYLDQRAKGIAKLLLTKKGVSFDDFDEIFQRAIFVFFDESKKDGLKILDRSDEEMDAEGFYRVWWRVVEIVIYDYRREYFRHEHFNDDEHEDAAIRQASLVAACNSVGFEDKIGTQMVFDKFNSIFENTANDKIKGIVNKIMKAPVSGKKRGRPPKSGKSDGDSMPMPLVSGVVFKPAVFDAHSDAAQKSGRIAAIRKLLGISIREYAVKLGIPEFRLASYIYGRVRVIPIDVLRNAERLLESEKTVAAATVAIEAMDMSEILNVWRLEIQGSNEDIASILGVSSSTMARWNENRSKPIIRKIREYNQMVDAVARLIKSKGR